jgi:outer membrane receptor protein involved in Fe transport
MRWQNAREFSRSSRVATAVFALCVLLGTYRPAFSESDPPPARLDSENSLVEIVVTAQKREERLSDVGMSITAETGDELAARGIDAIKDFSKIEPSFTYGQSSSGTPTFTIRGIGYYDFALAAPPAVTAYTDEVPFAYSSMTRGVLMDLDRVEILKGPQGILFGQNSTGGAINFIAAKPTSSLETGVRVTYGRFNATNVAAFISGPVTPTFRVRAAVDVDEGGAWQENYTRSDSLGNQNVQKIRLLGEWTPTDKFHLQFNVNGWIDRSDTQAGQLTGFVNPGMIAATVPALLASPLAPHDARAANWVPGLDPKADEHFYQTSLRANYEILPSMQLVSISAFSGYHTGSVYDFGGVPLQNESLRLHGNIHSFYQELRLSGEALDSRLKWLAGLNYASDKSTDIQHIAVPESTASYAFAFAGGPRWDSVENQSTSHVKTKSAFVNSSFDLTNQVSVHAGARYTDSRDSFNGCTRDPGDGLFAAGSNALQSFLKSFPPNSSLPYVPALPGQCTTLSSATLTPGTVYSDLNEHNVSWRAELNWKPAERELLYVSVTKGYKAGAFPTQAAIFDPALTPVTQESVLATEAGFKTAWLGASLQLDGAYFHYDYKNKQINGSLVTPLGVLFALINVPASEVNGFELSAKWRPVSALTLNASATYLDSRVTKDFLNTNTLGQTVNFKDQPFPFTPKWAAVAGARYDWKTAGSLNVYAGVDYSYRTSTQFAFGQLDFERIRSYGLLDLTAGVGSADARWFVELWGRNVTNTYYWTDASAVQDTEYRRAGMPVTYGIRFGYHYY